MDAAVFLSITGAVLAVMLATWAVDFARFHRKLWRMQRWCEWNWEQARQVSRGDHQEMRYFVDQAEHLERHVRYAKGDRRAPR